MNQVKYLQFILIFFFTLNQYKADCQLFNNFYSSPAVGALNGSRGISTTDGGALMGGTADNDIFLTKTNGSGELEWSFRYDINGVNFGDGLQSIATITKNSLGINGYLVVGTQFNDFNTNVNSSDAYVMKVSLTGQIVWIHGFTRDGFTCLSCGWDNGLSGVELADGSLAISMSVLGDAAIVRLDQNGNYLNGTAASSSKILNAGGCCPVAFASGEDLFAGSISSNGANYIQVGMASNDVLAFKYFYLLNYNLLPAGAAPTVAYGKMLGGSAEDKSLHSVDFLPNGDFVVCGYTKANPAGPVGDKDGIVMRIDPTGALVWARQFGSTSADDFMNVLYDAPTNKIVVQGVTDQFGATKEVAIILNLDGTVSLQSSLNISSIISDVSAISNDRYLFTGTNANRLHAYTTLKSDLSNSVCGSTAPFFNITIPIISDENVDPSFNSPFALSNTINNYGNGPNVVVTDLLGAATTTENIPNFGTSKVEATEVCEGSGTAQFNAYSDGSNLTYQWQENGVNLANGGLYSGVNTNTLSIANPPFSLNGKTYDLVVTGACGTITSNAAPLTVFKSPDATFSRGSIARDQNLCGSGIPTPLTESVPAAGGACSKYIYQWEKSENDGSTWSNVPSTVLASWDFAGNGGNSTVNASFKHANIASAVTALGAGLSGIDYLSNGFSGVNQIAMTLTDALAGNDYLSFTITPVAGKALDISKIRLRAISQNRSRPFALFSSVNGFSEAALLASFVGGSNSGNLLQPLHISGHSNITTAIEFRIYVYGHTDTYESVGFGNRQSGLNESDFIIEDAANLKTYAPPLLSATTLYRRKAYCNCDSLFSASVKITVNPIPVTNAGSNAPVCVGKPLNLTSTLGTGTSSYSWTGPNSFTSALQNPVIPSASLTNAGTYSVVLTQNGCVSVASNVLVNVKPTPTTSASSNSPICAGSNLSLSSNTGSATASYSWTGPNGFTSLLQNPIISNATVINSGTYSVTLTDNGCSSAANLISIVVNPLPTTMAGSNSPVCIGSAINFTSTAGSTSPTYSWTGPNGFVSNLQNPSIISASSSAVGSYSVTLTDNGCVSSPSTISVLVNILPVIDVTTSSPSSCGGTGSATITITTPSGNYDVDLDGDGIYEAMHQNLSPNSSGQIVISNLVNGTAIKNVKIKSVISGCESAVNTINTTISAPSSPNNSTDIKFMCADGIATRSLATTTPGGTWSLDPASTSGIGTVNNSTAIFTAGTIPGTAIIVYSLSGCDAKKSIDVMAKPSTTANSNSPVCSGSPINFTSTAGNISPTYSWTGPNGFVSTLQNPSIVTANSTSAGTYSVTLTENGCVSSPSTISVMVNTLPVIGDVTTSSPSSCGGTGSATITITSPSGNYDVDLDGDGIYEAMHQNLSPNSSGQIVISNLVNGTAIKNVKIKSVISGCESAVNTINTTISAPSSPNNSTDIKFMCADETATRSLATTTPGGTWSLDPASTSGIGTVNNSTAIFTAGTIPGTAIIVYSLSGCDAKKSIDVMAKPSTTANSNSPVCSGSPINFTSTAGSTSPTYSWTGPNGFVSTLQNPSIVSASSSAVGSYSVTLTENGCTSLASSVEVTVFSSPIATAGSNSPLCSGKNLNLNGSGSSGASFSWTGPNGFTSKDPNPIINNVTNLASGTYFLTIIENDCSSPPASVNVVVDPPQQINVSATDPSTCKGAGTATITLSIANGNYDVDLDGDGNYESAYLSSVPNGLDIFISNLQNGNIVRDVKVRSTLTGCESSVNPFNKTIFAPGSPTNTTDNAAMCADGKSIRNLTTTTPGGTWSLDVNSTSGVGVVNSASSTFTVGTTGGIAIVVYTLNGCPVQTNITVSSPSTLITVSSNSPICANNSLFFTTSGPETANYQWSGPNGFTSSLRNPLISSASPLNSGDYTVTLKDNGCGGGANTLSVLVYAIPEVRAESNSPVCEVGNLLLTTTGSSSAIYSWVGPNSYKSSSQNPRIQGVSVASKGKYTVTAIENGCESKPSFVIVSINPLPEINVSVLGSCGGDGSATITITNHQSGNYNVDLDGDKIYESIYQNLSTDEMGKLTVSNLAAGTIVRDVTVFSTSSNCKSEAAPIDTTISSNGIIVAPIVKDTTVCQGAKNLELDAITVSGAYLKWFSDAGQPLTVPPVPSTEAEGQFSYQVSQILNNCESEKSRITVKVIGLQVSAGSDKFINIGGSTEISATSNGDYVYNWEPAKSLNNYSLLKPTASPSENTMYTITALSKNGCSISSTMMVYITNDLFIPDGFSPNGDKLNDTWIIDGLESYPNAEMKVFNRWGGVVIKVKNYKGNEWDGNVGGIPLPVATYYYMLDLQDGSEARQGTITLVR